MKFKILALGVVVVLAVLMVTAWAADVTGKWTAQVPGRGGETTETTFNFKVEGTSLTGTMSGPMGDNPISDGKIDGDNISFIVKFSFGENEIQLLYKGKVSGNEIKFTREVQGGMGGRGGPQGEAPAGGPGGGGPRPPQEFTAKKVS